MRRGWVPLAAVCAALCFAGGCWGKMGDPGQGGNLAGFRSPDLTAAPATGAVPAGEVSLPRGNLVPNAFFSASGSSGDAPAHWTFDAWGRNSAKGSRITSQGVPGGRALRVEVSRYQDGDAKWSFDRVRLAGDTWYTYSDLHRSDGRSRLILSCKEAGGALRYSNIWQTAASAGWRRESVRFYLGPGAGCEATILHVVDRNGYLETAFPALVPVRPRPLARPLVSIAFDDGWKSAVTTARADLEARGFAGSYYLVKSFIGQDPAGGYASEADLRALLADATKKGHEIGSHSAHHKRLSLLASGPCRAELKENLDWLSGLGVARAGLAYPLGDFDTPAEAEVRALHPYARTSLDGLNDSTADRYRIKVLAVTNSTETASILARIDDAVRTSTWLVLLFHDIGDPDPANPYRTSREQYLAVLDRLAAGDVKVMTVAGALESLGI